VSGSPRQGDPDLAVRRLVDGRRGLRRSPQGGVSGVRPDLQVGEYTIVHVGFALQRLDEESALETLALFAQMGELDLEFGDPWERAASEAGLPVDVVSKTEVRP